MRAPEISPGVAELIRYGGVGGASAASYLAFSIPLDALGVPIWLSVTIARIVAMAVAYLGHLFVTFRAAPRHRVMLIRFLVSRGFAVLVSIAITYIAVDFAEAPYWVGAAAVVIVTPVISYPLLKLWVYR